MLFSFLFCSSYLLIIKLYILFRSAYFYFFSYFCKNEIKVQLRSFKEYIFVNFQPDTGESLLLLPVPRERKASVDEYSDDVLV